MREETQEEERGVRSSDVNLSTYTHQYVNARQSVHTGSERVCMQSHARRKRTRKTYDSPRWCCSARS